MLSQILDAVENSQAFPVRLWMRAAGILDAVEAAPPGPAQPPSSRLPGERNRRCYYATVASPFFSTSDSSLSDAPEGRFSPRSHLLTRLLVTFR